MRRCGLPFEALIDYYEGRADDATVERVRTHLATGCQNCMTALARLERTLKAFREPGLIHAPVEALTRASALFRERFRKPERPSLLAQLLFDSRATPALTGARGEAETSRQRVYSTDVYDIDLWQEREGENWYLIGQVMPKQEGLEARPEAVTLLLADGTALTAVFENEEFHLNNIPAGNYTLRVRLDEAELVLPDVAVGD